MDWMCTDDKELTKGGNLKRPNLSMVTTFLKFAVVCWDSEEELPEDWHIQKHGWDWRRSSVERIIIRRTRINLGHRWVSDTTGMEGSVWWECWWGLWRICLSGGFVIHCGGLYLRYYLYIMMYILMKNNNIFRPFSLSILIWFYLNLGQK